MSRIDKALRAWEESVGLSRGESEDIPSRGSTTIADYAPEVDSRREAVAAAALPLTDRVPAAPIADRAPAVPPVERPTSTPRADRASAAPILVDRAPAPVDRPPAPADRPPAPVEQTPAAPDRPSAPTERTPAPQPSPVRARVPAREPSPGLTSVERLHEPVADANAAARLVKHSTSGVSVEQYRRLSATLHEIQGTNGLKTVMVTSAAPNEGKTLTCLNVAYTLSESYARRVLVIDADLRRPSLHTLLGLDNTRGLSEVLSEERLELPLTEVSARFHVLTAGRPSTPLALLSSPRMRDVLAQCERRFDWILVDTPPVGVLPDAQVLARLTGGVVFVIGAGSTPAPLVNRAVAELGADCIIGTVLNRVDTYTISEAGYIDRYHSKQAAPVS